MPREAEQGELHGVVRDPPAAARRIAHAPDRRPTPARNVANQTAPPARSPNHCRNGETAQAHQRGREDRERHGDGEHVRRHASRARSPEARCRRYRVRPRASLPSSQSVEKQPERDVRMVRAEQGVVDRAVRVRPAARNGRRSPRSRAPASRSSRPARRAQREQTAGPPRDGGRARPARASCIGTLVATQHAEQDERHDDLRLRERRAAATRTFLKRR